MNLIYSAAASPLVIFKTEAAAAAMLASWEIDPEDADNYRVIPYGSRFVIAFYADGAFVGYV